MSDSFFAIIHNNTPHLLTINGTDVPSGTSRRVDLPDNSSSLIWAEIIQLFSDGDIDIDFAGLASPVMGLLKVMMSAQALSIGEWAEPVQDPAELVVIDVLKDKQLRLVEDKGGVYRYDAQSTATPDGDKVFNPMSIIPPAPGRWILALAAGVPHRASHQVGGSDLVYAAWLSDVRVGQALIKDLATYVDISFGTAFSDLDYSIVAMSLESTAGLANVNIYGTDKAVGGCRLNSSAAPGAGTKAEWDCSTFAAGNLDTILEAHDAGDDANSYTVAMTGDSPPAGGVTIDTPIVGGQLQIHYESGVSTVANVEAAIAALAGADDIIDVKTPGTGATVLSSATDDFAAQSPTTSGTSNYIAVNWIAIHNK